MVLVLCLGDLHVPYRAIDLPAKFKALLVPGKIHHVLCPGNLCTKETLDYLRTVCTDVRVTKGDFDDNPRFPEDEVLKIGDFRVGVCHGHQVVPWGDMEALAILQRKLDVDILVTGHTHEFKACKYQDRFMINPGSATGAFSNLARDVKPSFVLMDIDGAKATVYVYELNNDDDDVKVDKVEFQLTKDAEAL
ncbi:hypothetical protein WJX72_000370 [[Myrmecia] bisecta]|uniref:Vacuolar protein sorting-associated protein 29 n=1 Tax=[Myrmecia] bisecta TaxID=41462 RepID=A0AAW1Q093_9CHLO